MAEIRNGFFAQAQPAEPLSEDTVNAATRKIASLEANLLKLSEFRGDKGGETEKGAQTLRICLKRMRAALTKDSALIEEDNVHVTRSPG